MGLFLPGWKSTFRWNCTDTLEPFDWATFPPIHPGRWDSCPALCGSHFLSFLCVIFDEHRQQIPWIPDAQQAPKITRITIEACLSFFHEWEIIIINRYFWWTRKEYISFAVHSTPVRHHRTFFGNVKDLREHLLWSLVLKKKKKYAYEKATFRLPKKWGDLRFGMAVLYGHSL